MDFAVIRLAGKQYLVSQDSVIEITGSPNEVEVLLYSKNDEVTIGTPVLENVHVATEVLSTRKGEKIRVSKFKAKSRYRKTIGFRPLITTVKILSIGNEKISNSTGKLPTTGKGRTKKSSTV